MKHIKGLFLSVCAGTSGFVSVGIAMLFVSFLNIHSRTIGDKEILSIMLYIIIEGLLFIIIIKLLNHKLTKRFFLETYMVLIACTLLPIMFVDLNDGHSGIMLLTVSVLNCVAYFPLLRIAEIFVSVK